MFREIHDSHLEAHASTPEIAQVLERFDAVRLESGEAAFESLMTGIQDRFGPDLVVLERIAGGYRYRHAGAAVVKAVGFDMTGRTLAELPDAVGVLFTKLCDRALHDRRPSLAVYRALLSPSVHLWERLTLPCRTAEGAARCVILAKPRKLRSDVLSAVLEASCDGVMSVRAVRDGAGRVVDAMILTANRRAAEYAGYPIWELVDGRLLQLFPFFTRTSAWERCLRVIEQRKTERFEIRFNFRGLDTWLRTTVVPLDDGFVISMSDISDLRYALFEMEVMAEEAERARADLASEVSARTMMEGELRRIAITDGLTGVLNRRGFDDVVRQASAAARRYGQPLAVVAVDIDHFKRVNDRHGHAGGDTVLMAVAALFMEELRQDTDSIGRVGGEEFMFLLPHTDAAGAAALAERVRGRLMALPILVDADTSLSVTASFGVRAFDGDAERMLIEADDALYEAKRAGRNRVVVAGLPQAMAPAA